MRGWLKIGIKVASLSVVMACVQFSDKARFIGDLEFTDPDCEADRRCVLKNNFAYRDPFGVSWQAPAGYVTDGASIPEFLWDEVGVPFDPELVPAAAIHDFYCKNRVRSWQQTHRVFYDALITWGVPKSRADVLYAGVLLGGPRWNLDGELIDFGVSSEEIILNDEPPVVENAVTIPQATPDVAVPDTPVSPQIEVDLDVAMMDEETGEVDEIEAVAVDGEVFIEEAEFSDREQETQNDNAEIEIDYADLSDLIEENPDLSPEAIANMAAQIEP